MLLIVALVSQGMVVAGARAANADGFSIYNVPDDQYFSPNGDTQNDFGYIEYRMTEPASVTVTIKDSSGATVRTVPDVSHDSGYNSFEWDGHNDSGAVVQDGVYDVLIHAETAAESANAPIRHLGVDTRIPGRTTRPAPGEHLSGTAQGEYTMTAGFGSGDGNSIQDVWFFSSNGNGNRESQATEQPDGTWTAELDTMDYTNGDNAVYAEVSYQDPFNSWHSYSTVQVPVSVANPTRISDVEGDQRYFSPNGDNQEDTASVSFWLSEPATVTVTIDNENGVTVRTFDPLALRAGYNSFAWDGRNQVDAVVPDGRYAFAIQTVNSLGLTGSATGRLGVDTRVPGTMTRPTSGEQLTGTVPFDFTPTEGFGGYGLGEPDGFVINDIRFCARLITAYDGCKYADERTDGTWHALLDSGTFHNGENDATARVHFTDSLQKDHWYDTSVPVTVRNPPRFLGCSNCNDRYFSPNGDGQEDSVYVPIHLSDASHATITIADSNGLPVRTIDTEVDDPNDGPGFGGRFDWDALNDAGVGVLDGEYTYAIRAVNAGGLEATASGRLGIDRAMPGRISQPASGATVSGTVRVVFTPSVSTDASRVYFTATCVSWCYADAAREPDGTWTANMDTTRFAGGSNGLFTETGYTDPIGAWHSGSSSAVVPISVDNPPQFYELCCSRSFSPDGDGSEDTTSVSYGLSESALVTVTVSDTEGVVRTIESGVAHEGGTYLEWDGRDDRGAVVRDGIYTIGISATNVRDQQNSATIAVAVDRAGPGQLTRPGANDTLRGRTTFEFLPTPKTGYTTRFVETCIEDECAPIYSASSDGAWRTTMDTRGLPEGAAEMQGTVNETDPFGNDHRYSFTRTVVVDNTGPSVSVTPDIPAGPAPLDVSIRLDASDADGVALDYTLDFGDGSARAAGTWSSPYTTKTFPHSYPRTGVYRVVAAVSDGSGDRAQQTVEIVVRKPLTNRAPTATLDVSPTHDTMPVDATATIGGDDLDGEGLSYKLSFGDGTPQHKGFFAAGPLAFSHLYPDPGLYTVRLEVSDGSLSDIKTTRVTVRPDHIQYFALGDEFVAGSGCGETGAGYPSDVRAKLDAPRVDLIPLACKGARAATPGANNLAGQVDDVLRIRQSDRATVADVSITIGWNDLGIGTVERQREILCAPDTSDDDFLRYVDGADGVVEKVRASLTTQMARLMTDAGVKVALTEMYQPFNAVPHYLDDPALLGSAAARPCDPAYPDPSGRPHRARGRAEYLITRMNDMFFDVVRPNGGAVPRRAGMTRLAQRFEGHEGAAHARGYCGSSTPTSVDTWLQYPVDGAPAFGACLLPNEAGASQIADAVYLSFPSGDLVPDVEAPSSSFVTPDPSVIVELHGDRISGRSTDDDSGIADLTLTFTPPAGVPTLTHPPLHCTSAAKRNCTFDINPSDFGVVSGPYTVTVRALDKEGNAEAVGATIRVVIASAVTLP